jgi:site-specific recombinase XerD
MLKMYRRHLKSCRFTGRDDKNCACPIWVDGELHGRRYCRSLKVRDWQRAIRKVAALESPDAVAPMPVEAAIEAWRKSLDVEDSTWRGYRSTARALESWCKGRVETIGALTVDLLTQFRAERAVAQTTKATELGTLRQFLGFCVNRRWVASNPARQIPRQRGIRPAPVEPYTAEEVAAILEACGKLRQAYGRARARALVLLMRYTGLRISDCATLARNRAHDGQVRLFTQKTGGHIMLPIPGELEAALASLPQPRSTDGRDRGYFFWNGITSKRVLIVNTARLLRSAFTLSKVSGAHPHRFRHTLATSILANGGGMTDVADVLGITEQVARMHYAKWSPARQNRITAIMGAVNRVTPVLHEEKAARPN